MYQSAVFVSVSAIFSTPTGYADYSIANAASTTMIISAGISHQGSGLQIERKPGFPFWTAGFFLSGLTEIACAKETLLFPANSCVLLAPDTPYRLTVRKRQREIWMIFDARMRLRPVLPAPRGDSQAIAVTFRDSRVWMEVQAGLRDLIRWWKSQPPELLLAENAMERVLLLALREHGLQNQQIPDERIQRVVAHIDGRLGEELPVEELARVAGLSPSRFAHLFRQFTGLAPMKFLEIHRIERAKHLLLTTDLPVQEIGLICGLPNAQHFSVRFRGLTGQSPSAFRQAPKRRLGELNPDHGQQNPAR
jgi:AraC-like DNA-binding protein